MVKVPLISGAANKSETAANFHYLSVVKDGSGLMKKRMQNSYPDHDIIPAERSWRRRFATKIFNILLFASFRFQQTCQKN